MLGLTEGGAYLVLESLAVDILHHPLVDDAEGKQVVVGCPAIACQ